MLSEFAFLTLNYSRQGLVVQTELARSVRKDRDLNILPYEKQTRLIGSLLYATISTENLPTIFGIYQGIFQKLAEKLLFEEFELKTFFHSFQPIVEFS